MGIIKVCSSLSGERVAKDGAAAKRALDLDQTIVLGEAFAAAGGTRLDLTCAEGDREICNEL